MAELGVFYYNFRNYNPFDGRWISREPLEEEGAANLYGFVDNSPTDSADYIGLLKLTRTYGEWTFSIAAYNPITASGFSVEISVDKNSEDCCDEYGKFIEEGFLREKLNGKGGGRVRSWRGDWFCQPQVEESKNIQ